MEQVVTRQQKLQKALHTLEKVLDKFGSAIDFEEREIYRDSTIKRFEYCYDLLWKCLKDTLEYDHGIIVTSPRTVFYEIERLELVTKAELDRLLDMIDDRNLTSHTYNEKAAGEVFMAITGHYELMQKLATKISRKNNAD
jgi:nucleotidyltransferase substrate binding protein (TIGR01987 family)